MEDTEDVSSYLLLLHTLCCCWPPLTLVYVYLMLLTVTASLKRKTLWQDLFCTWFGLIIQWFTSTCLCTVFTAAGAVLNMNRKRSASQIHSAFLQLLSCRLYYICKWLDTVWTIFLLLSLINLVQTGILMKWQRALIIWEINYSDLSVTSDWPVANFFMEMQ